MAWTTAMELSPTGHQVSARVLFLSSASTTAPSRSGSALGLRLSA